MRLIYLILVCFAAPVATAIAWLRGLRDPSRRERLADRWGRPAIRSDLNSAETIWVHAASVGEVQAGAGLVRRLLRQSSNSRIVMTTMTATGAARVTSLFGDRVTHCFLPYDIPFAVRGFLVRAQPKLALILETELWPNLLRECRRQRLPVVIANARISPRTAARYRRFAALFKEELVGDVAIAAQTPDDAERFRQLGATNVQVVGNVKFDIEIPDNVRQAGVELLRLVGGRFVWVAGSTHEGEEVAALQAHRQLLAIVPTALLILAPRHPQRFDEVKKRLAQSGLSFVTRSSGVAPTTAAIWLIDTLGELLQCYAVCDAAFVGGSLVAVGGHNLLEPAAVGVPILAGPHLSSTQDSADLLIDAGALSIVRSADALADALIELSRDAQLRAGVGALGKQVVSENRGAEERVMLLVAQGCASTTGTATSVS